jgi:5-methylcytosine-specific restriction enzyme B
VAFLENTDAIHAATGDQVRRIQLHQAWSYEQFIGGLKLTENGTELEEGYLPELVREIDETREKHNDDLAPLPWVLILDELNRTDLSRLLGEAFSVLDDRDTQLTSPASATTRNGARSRCPRTCSSSGLSTS